MLYEQIGSRACSIAYSGARRTGFRGDGEKDSGLIAFRYSDGKANVFRSIPDWLSRSPECFQGWRRWTSEPARWKWESASPLPRQSAYRCATATNVRTSLRSRSVVGLAFVSQCAWLRSLTHAATQFISVESATILRWRKSELRRRMYKNCSAKHRDLYRTRVKQIKTDSQTDVPFHRQPGYD